MHNGELARDYLGRATVRREAIEVLHRRGSFADVVRESQEAVELALKGLLRACRIDPPRLHDVSAALLASQQDLPATVRSHVERLAEISRDLRRDRELAFYGTEDLVPSAFYRQADAERALADLDFVLATVRSAAVWRTEPPSKAATAE